MRRFVSIAAACATLCAAGPALARAPRSHGQPMVRCAVTICITHFRVQVAGQQYTSWVVPEQKAGGGDCYQQPWVKGDGEQSVKFSGSASLVEAMRIAEGDPTLEMRIPGQVKPEDGIAEGDGSVSRQGSLIHWVTGGQCGANQRPQTNSISGCGGGVDRWVFEFGSDAAGRVALSGGPAVPSLGGKFDMCPLLWTGSEAISGNDEGLYSGFTVPLPNRELFDAKARKIIVHGRYFAADPPPPGEPYSGLTGETLVQWTVTLTRIAHEQFPIVAQ
jgi:hypothetical protein